MAKVSDTRIVGNCPSLTLIRRMPGSVQYSAVQYDIQNRHKMASRPSKMGQDMDILELCEHRDFSGDLAENVTLKKNFRV